MVAKKSLMVLSISLILLISMSFISASWFSDLFTGGATNRIGAAGAVVPTRFGAGPSVPTKPIITNRVSLAPNTGATVTCPTGWKSTSAKAGGSCCVPSSGGTGGWEPKGGVTTQQVTCSGNGPGGWVSWEVSCTSCNSIIKDGEGNSLGTCASYKCAGYSCTD